MNEELLPAVVIEPDGRADATVIWLHGLDLNLEQDETGTREADEKRTANQYISIYMAHRSNDPIIPILHAHCSEYSYVDITCPSLEHW